MGTEVDQDHPWRPIIAAAQESARKAVEAHWAAGRSTFFSGTGAEGNRLFERTATGEVYEIERKGEEYVRVRNVNEMVRSAGLAL